MSHLIYLLKMYHLQMSSSQTCPTAYGTAVTSTLIPGPVSQTVGVDIAGPVYNKHGHIRKPVIVKTYICIFVSFTVKVVHIEPVSDLTTETFVVALRRFIARRGKPSEIFSDNGTNFVSAVKQLKNLYDFMETCKNQEAITDYCSTNQITWKFIQKDPPTLVDCGRRQLIQLDPPSTHRG